MQNKVQMREAKISSGDEDKHNVSVENEETTAGTAKLSEELQLPLSRFPQLKITDESRGPSLLPNYLQTPGGQYHLETIIFPATFWYF